MGKHAIYVIFSPFLSVFKQKKSPAAPFYSQLFLLLAKSFTPSKVFILLEKNGKTCNLVDFSTFLTVFEQNKIRLRRHFMVNYFNNVKKPFNFLLLAKNFTPSRKKWENGKFR